MRKRRMLSIKVNVRPQTNMEEAQLKSVLSSIFVDMALKVLQEQEVFENDRTESQRERLHRIDAMQH